MTGLTSDQIAALRNSYGDLINYEGDDPLAPIDPVTYREAGGDSLLHIASLRGDHGAVAMLLGAGIDPNILGDMGYTPLHYAALGKHRKTADLLISFGARPDAINEFGKAPDLSAF